jgi:phosphatidylglycerol:prolipoprotein diacylglycerol transferase
VYGAFFGGVLGMLLFLRKHPLPLLALGDLIAPSMLLGLAIGRVGCLMNGCCYGAVCDHHWAIRFPAGVQTPFVLPHDDKLDSYRLTREERAITGRFSPAYMAQLDRGQFYGFRLSSNPDSTPCAVLAVDPKSPAGAVGLKVGDRLESINGVEIAATRDAYQAIEKAFLESRPLEIRAKDRPAVTIAAISPPSRSLPVEPSQPLSTIDALLLCLLLLAYDPFRRRDGELFAIMMSIYPITRFLIESLRSDEAAVLGTGMSIAQCVCLLLLLCAAALWFYILRQPRGTAFTQPSRHIGSVGK